MSRPSFETGAPGDAPRRPAKQPARDWSSTPERSNLLALRAMAWVAVVCGRRVARWILHPITVYFLLFAPTQRRNAKRYLARALGRPARWRDGYRLIHAFASTVLDRVYFLRGHTHAFDLRSSGVEPVDTALAQGQGAFLIGAHVGSFEAIGASGRMPGGPAWRVAMLMYPDNAQRINGVLDAIGTPGTKPCIIALGRPGSMLTLRDWLDGGGVAGTLADRTLPGESERGGTVELPFLGHMARFSDGPFRLAALLRRPVFLMTGLYAGGRRYDVRFAPLADFSVRPADA
ncbi:MAG: acyl-CoA synthetase, partial [Variovorax sp.]|nr:acyl-CoA synthetase [Variovorax sp.]